MNGEDRFADYPRNEAIRGRKRAYRDQEAGESVRPSDEMLFGLAILLNQSIDQSNEAIN